MWFFGKNHQMHNLRRLNHYETTFVQRFTLDVLIQSKNSAFRLENPIESEILKEFNDLRIIRSIVIPSF